MKNFFIPFWPLPRHYIVGGKSDTLVTVTVSLLIALLMSLAVWIFGGYLIGLYLSPFLLMGAFIANHYTKRSIIYENTGSHKRRKRSSRQ